MRHRARCGVSHAPAGPPATPAYRLLPGLHVFPSGTPRRPVGARRIRSPAAVILHVLLCFFSSRLGLFPEVGIKRVAYTRALFRGVGLGLCPSVPNSCPAKVTLPGLRQRTSGLRRDSVHRRRPPAAPRRCTPRAPSCAHRAWAPVIHPASSYTRPVSRRLVSSPIPAFRSPE